MRVEYTHHFIKELKKTPNKTQIAFRKKLELFLQNKYGPLLNNHALSGKLAGYRSINITGDWRALFQENGESVCFMVIGTHGKLYK